MTNRLANCSSPYLRQHQSNPVDWYPWGAEALERSKAEDKPIFLSIGYSACHWCHVMEHESFENDAIAQVLNSNFVSIKVDREERPDLDQIYMQAVQMLTGSGGWPMSVFLSSDGQPFYGGTYWPPDNRHGRPGFGQVLMAIIDAWQNRRDEIAQQGQQITEHLQQACRGPDAADRLDATWIAQADEWLLKNHDSRHGGFGSAPKFPHAMDLSLLVERQALEPTDARRAAIETTLDKMAGGGIYDHLGGGFARYSVDDRWLVPHFEKMLYDNALLAVVYADAFRLWNKSEYAQVLRETLDYTLRTMTNPQGGYYSTEDADSEGVEGKFYVWTVAEILQHLGEARGQRFCQIYDVSESGNFEGTNILNLPVPLSNWSEQFDLDLQTLQSELEEDRATLLAVRDNRVRPGLDDKVLLSWNALMITAMTRGYRALDESKYLDSAISAVDFISRHMLRDDGHLWHTWRDGAASLDAYLDDYTYLIDSLCELFQVHPEVNHLRLATNLADIVLAEFSDEEGGFFFTADNHEPLVARSKDLVDSSVPSGNAMAASSLLTLSQLTGDTRYRDAAESALRALSGVMTSSPQAAGQGLRALQRFLLPSQEYVLFAGQSLDTQLQDELRTALLQPLRPQTIGLWIEANQAAQDLSELCPLVQQRHAQGEEPTLFVCHDTVCQAPKIGDSVMEFLRQPDSAH